MKSILTVNDVSEILERKEAYCYKVIRELNKELEAQGYYVNSGRIPAKYFCERLGIDVDYAQ